MLSTDNQDIENSIGHEKSPVCGDSGGDRCFGMVLLGGKCESDLIFALGTICLRDIPRTLLFVHGI